MFHRVKEPSSTTWLNNYDYRHSFNLFWTKLFLWKYPLTKVFILQSMLYIHMYNYICICIYTYACTNKTSKSLIYFPFSKFCCFLVFVYICKYKYIYILFHFPVAFTQKCFPFLQIFFTFFYFFSFMLFVYCCCCCCCCTNLEYLPI